MEKQLSITYINFNTYTFFMNDISPRADIICKVKDNMLDRNIGYFKTCKYLNAYSNCTERMKALNAAGCMYNRILEFRQKLNFKIYVYFSRTCRFSNGKKEFKALSLNLKVKALCIHSLCIVGSTYSNKAFIF